MSEDVAKMREAAERQRLQQLAQQQQTQELARQQRQAAEAARRAAEVKPQPVYTPPHAEGSEELRKTPKVYTGPKVTSVSTIGETKPPAKTQPTPTTKQVIQPQFKIHELWAMENPEIKLPETGRGQPDIRPLYVSMLKAFDHAAEEWYKRAHKDDRLVMATPPINDIKDDIQVKLPSTYKIASKNIPEVLMHGTTALILGSIEEVTFPAGWGVVPPRRTEDRVLRLVGGLLTPSPIDYAATALIRKLALRKNGAKLIDEFFMKRVPLEKRLAASQSIMEIIQSEKFGRINVYQLRQAGRALGGSADELIENANRIDDTLTSITGQEDWAGKINLVPSKQVQRDIFNEFNIQLSELRKAIDDLAPVKGGKLTRFGQLSPEDQRKFAKVFNEEVLKYWEAHPERFTAGAAYKPSAVVDIEDMLEELNWEPDDIVDFMAQNGGGTLPVGVITQILRDLNESTDKAASEADLERYRDRPDLYQLHRPFSKEVEAEELRQDQPAKLEEDEKGLIGETQEPREDTTQEPREDTVQEPDMDTLQEIQQVTTQELDEEAEEEEPPRDEEGRFLPRTDEEKRRKLSAARFYTGKKRRFKAQWDFPSGKSQTLIVEAADYVSATQAAARARALGRELPIELNLWVLEE